MPWLRFLAVGFGFHPLGTVIICKSSGVNEFINAGLRSPALGAYIVTTIRSVNGLLLLCVRYNKIGP